MLLVAWLGAACGTSADGPSASERTFLPGVSLAPVTTVGSAVVPAVTVRYRLERRTADAATDDFERVVRSTLEDPRGWARAGFSLVPDPAGEFRIVLAEAPEVDRLCLPYDTFGLYSCQIGLLLALNAARWREATRQWTGDLAGYRAMLVNHEVGHLLGLKHPDVQCPAPGKAAPVMAQQSTELGACLPNRWPLEPEIERAGRHDLPLAPPFER